jgi:hypothetical protein
MNDSIKVYDDFLPSSDNDAVQLFFKDLEWKYGYKSLQMPVQPSIPHWSKYFFISDNPQVGTPIDEVNFESKCLQSLYDQIKPLVKQDGHSTSLLRCYANAHTIGIDSRIHVDDKRDNTTTALFYPMQQWSIDWGGQTIFWHKSTREVIKSIIPKSNRLIVFDSTLWHGASPLTSYCTDLRMTLMFKFIHYK